MIIHDIGPYTKQYNSQYNEMEARNKHAEKKIINIVAGKLYFLHFKVISLLLKK